MRDGNMTFQIDACDKRRRIRFVQSTFRIVALTETESCLKGCNARLYSFSLKRHCLPYNRIRQQKVSTIYPIVDFIEQG